MPSSDQRSWTVRRRTLLGAAGAGGLAAATGLPVRTAAAAAEIVDLGVAMLSVNVRFAAGGTLPDGTPVIFAMSDGNPVSFNVLRISDGERLAGHQLGPDTIGACLVQHPDGRVYFSVRGKSTGLLLRYDPSSDTVETLAEHIVGENFVRNLTVDPDTGTVYGSTYAHAKVFGYDPATGAVRDYGSLTTTGDRVWGLAWVHGEVWAGTGMTDGRLVRIDPATGTKTDQVLPAPVTDNTRYLYSIQQRGRTVIIGLSPGADGVNSVIFDLDTGQWRDHGGLHQPVGMNGHVSEPDSGGRCYYASAGEIYAYSPAGNTSVATGIAETDLAPLIGETRTLSVSGSGPDESLHGITPDGTVWTFGLSSGATTTVKTLPIGSPATLHTLGLGPDDKVYVGAYLSSGVMARASTSTYELEALAGPGQSDQVVAHDGRIYVTSYPNAVVYSGTVDPWDWGSNPKELFRIGRAVHRQDRIFDVCPVLDLMAYGSVPDYGELGGAITLADGDGDFAVYRNVVPDQSITALAACGPLLFAGSSIHGGLDSTPAAAEAKLIIFDARTRRVIFETVPIPGDDVIHTLLVHRGRRVWGMGNSGTVFEFDIAGRKVLRSADTGLAETNSWGRLGSLYWRDQDQRFYGNAGGRLFRLDPATLATTELTDGVKVSVLAPTGDIFFGNASNLFVYRL